MRIAASMPMSLRFRCPYQANVMKVFEIRSKSTVLILPHSNMPLLAYDMLRLLILVAHILVQLFIGRELQLAAQFPGVLVRSRVVDGDLNLQSAQVRTPHAFDHVQLFRLRLACNIHPAAVMKTYGVDDERVLLPVPDGMSRPRWIIVGRMPAAISEDLPKSGRAAFGEDD